MYNKNKSPIVIINLKRDTERWVTCYNNITSKGVDKKYISRFNAIDGKSLEKEKNIPISVSYLSQKFATPGMIGCFLSHYICWKNIIKDELPWRVILEDDISITNNFMENVNSYIQELDNCNKTKNTWDVLILGGFGWLTPEGPQTSFFWRNIIKFYITFYSFKRKPIQVTENCCIPMGCGSTCGYILSQRGAKKLLNKIGAVTNHVDMTAWKIRDLNIFSCNKPIVYQNCKLPSTIGGKITKLEKFIPNMQIEKDSNLDLAFYLNSPIIYLPKINFVLSLGRILFLQLILLIITLIFSKKYPILFMYYLVVYLGLSLFVNLLNTATPGFKYY